jgi:hypothetical protein
MGQAGAPARRVAGMVMYNGQALSGALVVLENAATDAGAPPASQKTDARGQFDFGNQPASFVVVSASYPGLLDDLLGVSLADPSEVTDGLVLTLTGCGATVHGTVTDVSGGPVVGARVMAQSINARSMGTAGDLGGYELCVLAGPVTVLVSAPGYADAAAITLVNRRGRADIALMPEATVHGVVLGPDGEPVEGALVQVAADDQPEGRTISREDGSFTVTGLKADRFRLSAKSAGLVTSKPVDVRRQPGQTEEPIVLRLEPAVLVQGILVGADDQPLAGEGLVFSVDPMSDTPAAGAVSQRDGTFSVELGPGPATLYATHGQADPAAITVERGMKPVKIRVVPMASVSGRVVRAGSVVRGALVSIRRAGILVVQTRSVASGTFELLQLSPGSYEIDAASEELGAYSAPASLLIVEGLRQHVPDLELSLAAEVSGVVVDQHGAAMAGAYVWLSLLGGADFGEALTEEDGAFRVRSLSGGGDYSVEVRPSPRAQALRPVEGDRLQAIHVADGTSVVTGVRLAVQGGKPIAGRVVRDGAPVADASVRLLPDKTAQQPGALRRESEKAISTSSGAFSFPAVADGTYDLWLSTPTGQRQEVTGVRAGDTSIVIELPALGSIEGTLAGFSQPPRVAAHAGRGMPMPAQVEGERFVIHDVAPGLHAVYTVASVEGDLTYVDVKSRQTARTSLVNRAAGTVRIHVTAAETKTPVPGISCGWVLIENRKIYEGASSPMLLTDEKGLVVLQAPAQRDLTILCHPSDWEMQAMMREPARVPLGGSTDVQVTLERRISDGGF